MLWDLIRDFFVLHIFGGNTSTANSVGGLLGFPYDSGVDDNIPYYSSDNMFNIFGLDWSLGDYLSTTATIITISIIVVLCCLFVYKIIKLIGGLIR